MPAAVWIYVNDAEILFAPEREISRSWIMKKNFGSHNLNVGRTAVCAWYYDTWIRSLRRNSDRGMCCITRNLEEQKDVLEWLYR